MTDRPTVKVFDPYTESVLEVPIPSVVVLGTFNDCTMMLIMDADPTKCAKFHGDLANEPELRAYLEENKSSIIRVGLEDTKLA